MALEARDGRVIRVHHKNVWQTLRLVTDASAGKIHVWLNGKLSKTLDFESAERDLDEFLVSFEADKPSEAMFSDLRIWEVPKEPEDYVPEPVIPRKKRPIAVGINVCSLWRNGTHAGWISVGFNNVGWGGERRPLMKNSDMKKGLVHCIETYLPLYPKSSPFSHMLHLSTWNEYGEGTYIMPSGLCGFGYLDAVRSALCEDTPHTDVVPDEAQKARIGYLYPDSRRKLKRQGYDERPLPEKEIFVRKLEFKTQEDLDKWEFRGMKNVRIEDGILKGETTEPFAEMELKTVGWDASEISYLRVDCANKLYSNGEPQNIFLIPSNVPDKSNYSRENAARIWCNSLVPYEYRPLHLDNHAWWSGTIYGFKIIPVEHGTFELRSVTFFAALKHLCIYGSDNRPLFFGDYPAEHGKDIVIPLDPESGLYKTLGIKTYEWFKDSGTLELCTQKSRYTVVCGRAYAQKDEHDVMLSHPVMLKDAVPALYLEDVCQLFGVKYERNTEKNILRLMTE